MTDINDYPWSILNVEKLPEDVRGVKRAYARQLKQIDRSNVDEFQQLQNAYQYALMIIDDKPAKPTMRSMIVLKDTDGASTKQKNLRDFALANDDEIRPKGLRFQEFSNSSEETYEKLQLKDLSFSNENEIESKPSLKDLTFTYETTEEGDDEADEEFHEAPKLIKTARIYDELADPKNLSLKKWQAILSKEDLDNLKEKSKIEIHILTILSGYITNVKGSLKFNKKVPQNLIAYLQDQFDFEKYHNRYDENITNVLLALSAKHSNPYLSYFNRFILYTFYFLALPVAIFKGQSQHTFIIFVLSWIVTGLTGIKIMQSQFKIIFNYLGFLAIAAYIGMALLFMNSPMPFINNPILSAHAPIHKVLFIFIAFWLLSNTLLFSVNNFHNETSLFHKSFCTFHSWHLSLIVLVLPQIVKPSFSNTIAPFIIIYTILTTIFYGYYLLFKKELF